MKTEGCLPLLPAQVRTFGVKALARERAVRELLTDAALEGPAIVVEWAAFHVVPDKPAGIGRLLAVDDAVLVEQGPQTGPVSGGIGLSGSGIRVSGSVGSHCR